MVNETNGLASQESSVRIEMNNNGWGYAAHDFNVVTGKIYEIKTWIKPSNFFKSFIHFLYIHL